MLALAWGSSLPGADLLGRPPATLDDDPDARPVPAAAAPEGGESLAPSASDHRVVSAAHSTAAPASPGTTARWTTDPAGNVTASPTAWKLRWRNPSVPKAATAEAPLAVARASASQRSIPGSRGSAASPQFPVQQVTFNGPVDPFAEPPPRPQRSVLGQPIAQEQPAAPEAAPPAEAPPAVEAPASDAPAPPSLTPESEPAPLPPGTLPATPGLGRGNGAEVPCDRNYNGRNCCADDEECRRARQYLSQFKKISSISLDITPSFTNTESPGSANFVPTEVRRQQELANAPSRTWRNRQGAVIAEGRMENYRSGHVHVTTASGETLKLLYLNLSDDDLCFVAAYWSLPSECYLPDDPFQPRNWLASTFTWKASGLCHKPLYFEEVGLERYGHSVGPLKQPFVSGAHFFGSLAFLPYQMGIHPVNECQYSLGYYRPGSCAPWLVPPFPVSIRGGLLQAGTMVGGAFILP